MHQTHSQVIQGALAWHEISTSVKNICSGFNLFHSITPIVKHKAHIVGALERLYNKQHSNKTQSSTLNYIYIYIYI